MHETLLVHVTAWSCRAVAARLGVGCIDHADPFHPSAIVEPLWIAPTVVQSVDVTQLTPARTALATSALDCSAHVVPFHDSAIAFCAFAAPVNHPTAVQDAGPAHETASR
jgi:hypothetical protein